jgi:hypothetical protein
VSDLKERNAELEDLEKQLAAIEKQMKSAKRKNSTKLTKRLKTRDKHPFKHFNFVHSDF